MKFIFQLIMISMIYSLLGGCGSDKSTTKVSETPKIPDVKDASFGSNGFRKSEFTGTPVLIDGRDMDVNENGDLVIVGVFETLETQRKQIAVTLMDSDGSLIDTFGNNGQKNIAYPLDNVGNNVAFQGDKILLGGQQGPYIIISRIDSAGEFDASFRNAGSFREDRINIRSFNYIREMAVDSSDRIYVSGRTSPNDIFVLRYLPNGEPDPSFGVDGIVNYGYDKPIKGGHLTLSPDGRIIVSGTLSQTSREVRSAVIVFMQDGSVDTTFGSDGISIVGFDENQFGLYNRGITADDQGRLIVVSSNNINSYSTQGVIYRLNADGLQDMTFGDNGLTIIKEGASVGLFKPAMDGDKIVVSGYLRESLLGDTDLLIVRLLSTGKLDNSYGYKGKGIIKIGELSEGRDTIVNGGRYYVGGYVVGGHQSLIGASKR